MTLARRFYLVVNEMKVTRLQMEESNVFVVFMLFSPNGLGLWVYVCGWVCGV